MEIQKIGRPKKKSVNSVHLGFQIDAQLWSAIMRMAQQSGVSGLFVLKRALQEVVNSGEIPWPSKKEMRDHKKFGAATPVYDGESEEPVQGSGSGRKVPSSPAE